MKFYEKFPALAGEHDPRVRRSLAPARIVTASGDVSAPRNLIAHKSVQIALGPHSDGCILKNPAEGTRAGVLLDFGTELHGSLCVSVYAVTPPPGAPSGYGRTVTLRIRLGESVSEALTPVGERGTTNDHATRDFTLPVASLSSNESPESGFRFAYVELETPAAAVELRAVTATLIIRDLEYIGSFESSDPLLGKIYDTAAYTVHLNMQRYLWDGIKRDRLVWAGDMNTEIAAILAVFGDSCDVVRRSLDFARDVTPAGEAMNTIRSYTLWWILAHYDWYMGTGDRDYLMQQKEYLKELLPRYFGYIGADGRETMGGYFDWPTQGEGNKAKSHAGRQGLFCLAMRAAAELLRCMGESELSLECTRREELLRSYVPDPAGYKQAAAMLALANIGDPAATAERVILPGGPAGLSSFLGYYTLSAAAEAGRVDAALEMIRGYWGGMLEMGATTFWEDFDISWTENAHRIDELPAAGMKDIHGDFGAFCYKNFRHSLCHGWASGPAPVLAKYVLGVRPFAPGMRAVRFAPELGGLDWARGTVPTPRGVIRVELERGRGGRTLGKIDAPDGVEVIVK